MNSFGKRGTYTVIAAALVVAAAAADGCIDDAGTDTTGPAAAGTGPTTGSGGKGATSSAGTGGKGTTSTSSAASGGGGAATTVTGSATTSTSGTGGGATTSTSGTGGGATTGTGGSSCTIPDAGAQLPAPAFSKSWTFDTDLQPWSFPSITGTFDSTDGSPTPGSAKLVIPFTASAQQFSLNQNFSSPLDLTGKTLSARVRLKSCNAAASVQAFIVIKTTSSYVYARSAFTTLSLANGWVTLNFDPTKPDFLDTSQHIPQDLTDVLEIDVGFISAGAGPFTDATINVDTVGISVPSTGTGGSGGGGGAAASSGSGSTASSSAGTGGAASSSSTGAASTASSSTSAASTASSSTGAASTASSSTGAGGSGGSSSALLLDYTFDTTAQSWLLGTFNDGSNLAALAALPAPTAVFDSTDGIPSPGSLKLTATYTSYNQYIDPQINFATPPNLLGKTLHVKVKLDSGSFTGFVVVHASTAGYASYANGLFVSGLVAGAWTDLVFDLSTATSTGWDPTIVNQVGVQFGTGDPPTVGAVFPGPVNAVFHVDTFTD